MNHVTPAATALVFCLALACASREPAHPSSVEPATCGSIQQIHRVGDVYLAGQPDAADLARARELGIETVINLRGEAELAGLGFDEPATAAELGLEYVSLPFSSADELTDDVFARTRALLDTAERPILLHCGSANRVGAVWLTWRVLDEGVPYDEALVEARAIGLRSPALEAKAADYIERGGR